jgi:hypothetical protein
MYLALWLLHLLGPLSLPERAWCSGLAMLVQSNPEKYEIKEKE